jgi:hypothetical protein
MHGEVSLQGLWLRMGMLWQEPPHPDEYAARVASH